MTTPFQTLFRKELADHFSAVRFPLTAALLFMAALVTAYLAGGELRAWLREGLHFVLEGRAFLLLFALPGAVWPVFLVIAYLGPPAALLFSFDTVNRERVQGTLSKLLAQPIRRDEVLGAKYLAGLTTLAILTGALVLLVTGLALTVIGLEPTPGEILRLGLFWLLSLIYLGFWLGAGLSASIVCRTAPASALASAALWVFMSFFVTFLAAGAAGALAPASDPLRPAREEVDRRERLYRQFSLTSPVHLYREAAGFLLDPASRSPDPGLARRDRAVTDRYTGRFIGPLDFSQTLILVLPHTAALLAWSALTFWLSGLLFRRQEVRATG